MRSSLREMQQIEAYLLGQLSLEDQQIFQQRLLFDTELFDQMQQQRATYHLIQQRGRRQLRQELNQVHTQLFNATDNRSWQRKIRQYFKKLNLR